MGITLTPVDVDTGSLDREGLLVFDGDRLVAILIRLSEIHEDRAGSWHFEYGPGFRGIPEAFESLDQASEWMNQAKRSS